MALLDNKQLASIHPFFGTALGRFCAKVFKKILSLDKFIYYYELSGEDGSRGPDFAHNVCINTKTNYKIGGLENIKDLKGPFITVSNHPYGGMDGIVMVDLFGHLYPGYKFIVNDFLSLLEYMGDSFIPVKPAGKDKTAASTKSIRGLLSALNNIRDGQPIGVFPAGAVSTLKLGGKAPLDRPWQESMIKFIRKAGVPVVPVHFHDRNSRFFYFLGYISRNLRILRLPKEVINKRNKNVRLTIGKPITVEEQQKFAGVEELGNFLRETVYSLPLTEELTERFSLKI